MGPGAAQNPELIAPANDNLFSSGTLGRYSRTLNSVMENKNPSRRNLKWPRIDEFFLTGTVSGETHGVKPALLEPVLLRMTR